MFLNFVNIVDLLMVVILDTSFIVISTIYIK